jgi:putative iron-regulated protein
MMRLALPLFAAILVLLAAPALADDGARGRAIDGYAALAQREYDRAVASAESLQVSIRAFLATPSVTTIGSARRAWSASHEVYGRTEVFRFADGPIDGVHPVTGEQGPEGRINAWPVDEAFLDYVAGSSTGGLIADRSLPITAETLAGKNGAEDETQVTLGFHAIEFLLWGQDRNPDGPGNRPSSDYLRGDPIRDRRRACLELITNLLVDDLSAVASEWKREPGRYASSFLALPPGVALGQALSGAASLAGFELAAERIGVPLSSGGQEDEESCFSDTTHRDFAANVAGIVLVLAGDGGAPGLLSALAAEPAADIRARLARIQELVRGIEPPFDRLLATPADDPRRVHLQVLEGELLGLAGALQRAGGAMNLQVTIGIGG